MLVKYNKNMLIFRNNTGLAQSSPGLTWAWDWPVTS